MARAALSVRVATEADLPFLSEAEALCFSDPWGEAGLRSHGANDASLSLILLYDGRPAGYLLGMLIPPEAEIYRLAVLPDYRRCGGGRALWEAAHARARAAGCTCWFLDVRESNAPARALYDACGFCEVGRRRGYYTAPREDAVLMERKER